jgi:glycosyltransferase involved in cell wall biosynthesis
VASHLDPEQGTIFPSTVLLRRECVEQVGGYDEVLDHCADVDLWVRIARLFPIEALDAATVLCRDSRWNLPGEARERFRSACQPWLQKIYEQIPLEELVSGSPAEAPPLSDMLEAYGERAGWMVQGNLLAQAWRDLQKAEDCLSQVDAETAAKATPLSPLVNVLQLIPPSSAEDSPLLQTMLAQKVRAKAASLWARGSGLVSIVMATHNQAPYLRQAVDSVLQQTYPHLELVVVDDSTDETPDILAEYTDPRLRVIRFEKRLGISEAFNVGFNATHGQYVGRLCSDDLLAPTMVEVLVRTLQENPACGLAHADYQEFGESDRTVSTEGVTFESIYFHGRHIGPCWLLRTEILRQLPRPLFDDLLRGVEDAAFYLDLFRVARFLHVPQVLYYYRRHEQQLTQQILDTTGFGPLLLRMQQRYDEKYRLPWQSVFPAARLDADVRVLFVYFVALHGGIEATLRNRIAALRKHQVEVEICIIEDQGGASLYRGLCRAHIIGSRDDRMVLSQLVKLLREEEYDIVTLIDTPMAYQALREAACQAAVIVEFHAPRWVDRMKPATPKNTDLLIAVSQFVANRCQQENIAPGVPLAIIPNAVPLEDFQPNPAVLKQVQEQLELSPNQRLIAWVGRLDPPKNYRLFLRLARRLADVRDDVLFWMAGGGEYPQGVENLKQMVSELGLESHLRWFPLIEHEDMPAFYHAVAASQGVLVITSVVEGFCLVALEAMAAGVPVVSSNAPALAEALAAGPVPPVYAFHDGYPIVERQEQTDLVAGVLVEQYDEEGFLHAVSGVLDDGTMYERLRVNGLDRVQKYYNLECIVKQYRDLYLALKNRGRRSRGMTGGGQENVHI